MYYYYSSILGLPGVSLCRINGVGQYGFVIFRSNKPRITVIFEQELVDVGGGNLKSEPTGRFHGYFCSF